MMLTGNDKTDKFPSASTRKVKNRQTDRRTDRQTDKQTDIPKNYMCVHKQKKARAKNARCMHRSAKYT